jgi:HPt (histidine-containing phosphotransfer) domain-containing protein
MNDYISKPFSLDKLRKILEKWLHANFKPHSSNTAMAESNPNVISLNADALDKLKALQRPGQPDIISTVFNMFIENSPALIDSLTQGLEDNNKEAIVISVHTLKSSSANIGATQFSIACAELEKNIAQYTYAELANYIERIKEHYTKLEITLKKHLEEHTHVNKEVNA